MYLEKFLLEGNNSPMMANRFLGWDEKILWPTEDNSMQPYEPKKKKNFTYWCQCSSHI